MTLPNANKEKNCTYMNCGMTSNVIDVAVQEPGMNRVGEYKRNPLDSSVTKVGKNLYKSL